MFLNISLTKKKKSQNISTEPYNFVIYIGTILLPNNINIINGVTPYQELFSSRVCIPPPCRHGEVTLPYIRALFECNRQLASSYPGERIRAAHSTIFQILTGFWTRGFRGILFG